MEWFFFCCLINSKRWVGEVDGGKSVNKVICYIEVFEFLRWR